MKTSFFALEHQGGRHHMEDSHFLIRNFGGNKNWILGGVFDGPGGNSVANLASAKLPEIILGNLQAGMTEEAALKNAYSNLCYPSSHLFVGCCALTFLLKDDNLYVANSGDCRMILVSSKRTVQLSRDHRVTEDDEYERIISCGGIIREPYACLANGHGLMPTRTLGDGQFKSIGIISDPEVFHHKIPRGKGIYLVAATDGLWDERDNKWVAKICREMKSPRKIANEIVGLLVGYQSEMQQDNITVIVMKLSPKP